MRMQQYCSRDADTRVGKGIVKSIEYTQRFGVNIHSWQYQATCLSYHPERNERDSHSQEEAAPTTPWSEGDNIQQLKGRLNLLSDQRSHTSLMSS